MEGLDYSDGRNIFVFKDAQTFLQAYRALLDNGHYRQVARDAFTVLKDKYSLEAFTKAMDENWKKMAGPSTAF
jgi:hypothetical protein